MRATADSSQTEVGHVLVTLGERGDAASVAAGFSDVSGLGNEVKYSEYRNGNDTANHVRKIANTNTTDDVTLKRGVVGDLEVFRWIDDTRQGQFGPRTVVITLLDEARAPVCEWVLRSAQPKKWVGSTLAAKGGGEVAMEELHLVAEQVDFRLSS
jgi:phage tail-like protein